MATTDVAVLDVTEVELAADPGHYVIQACERAKTWLAHALEHGGIDQIVEMKCQAEAIRVYTMSKQLGLDAQLSAAEIVRRAERGIGLAIRRGQEAGEIAKPGDVSGPQNDYVRNGREVRVRHPARVSNAMSPKTFFANGTDHSQTYAVTDGVTDEQFEAAITEAKAEGNLSRANLVRKVKAKKEAAEAKEAAKEAPVERDLPDPDDRTGFANMQRRAAVRALATEGYSSQQIAEKLGRGADAIRQMAREMQIEIPADKATGRSGKAIDPNRVVRETVHALDGLAMGVGLILDDLSGLDPAEIANWTASLTESTRTLNRLIKRMKEMAQ